MLLTFSLATTAQRKNARYLKYINTYSDLAIEHMQKYKIPASITLSQGLLESGAGMSQLARRSNNHFGIKCGGGWRGKSVRHDDDLRNECFRAYSDAEDSYKDHSVFLSRGARYRFLFKLDIRDYKGWAKGLKRAGYATNPAYANLLIRIIETYELYKYDEAALKGKHHRSKKSRVVRFSHQPYIANDLVYILAKPGDTFESLEDEFDVSAKKLRKYNDYVKGYPLKSGDIVYLKKKHRKACKPNTVYVVKSGDTMHSISQMFGVRLKNLYKMNRKKYDSSLKVGERLRLR